MSIPSGAMQVPEDGYNKGWLPLGDGWEVWAKARKCGKIDYHFMSPNKKVFRSLLQAMDDASKQKASKAGGGDVCGVFDDEHFDHTISVADLEPWGLHNGTVNIGMTSDMTFSERAGVIARGGEVDYDFLFFMEASMSHQGGARKSSTADGRVTGRGSKRKAYMEEDSSEDDPDF